MIVCTYDILFLNKNKELSLYLTLIVFFLFVLLEKKHTHNNRLWYERKHEFIQNDI